MFKVAKLHKDAILPVKKHDGDVGWDLYSKEDATILPHSFYKFDTGLTIEYDAGVRMELREKGSQLALVSGGIFEHTYQGPIVVKLVNYTDFPIDYKVGDPLCQMVFVHALEVNKNDMVVANTSQIHQEKTERAATGSIHKTKITSEMYFSNEDYNE